MAAADSLDRCRSWPRGHRLEPTAPTVVDELLGVSTAEFSRERPLLVQPGLRSWDGVFSLDAARRLIDSGTLTESHFDFVRESERTAGLSTRHLQGAVARRALDSGTTILLRAVDYLWPGPRDLAVALSSELEEIANVNAFLTPGQHIGILRHADGHDVIVIQLHGSKHWRVFDAADEVVLDTSLKPGDVLYVPHGWAHEVRADSFSLHLTIGLLGPSWSAVLSEALSSLAHSVPGFDGPPEPEGVRERLSTLADEPALEEVARAVLAKEIARSQTSAPPVRELGSPPPDPPGLDVMLVRRVPLFAAALERGGRPALVFAGRRIDGSKSLGEAFRFVADNAAFRAAELTGAIDDELRRKLAGRLVAEGLVVPDADLEVAPATGAAAAAAR